MTIKSLEISQNPVTVWEEFSHSLYPTNGKGRRVASGTFFDFDRDIRAEHGFGRCRFKFSESTPFLKSFFEWGLGRHIIVHNHKGLVDYEGYILALTLNTGHHILRQTMNNLANVMWARYDATGGVGATQRSTPYTNTASKARFGHFERTMGGGQQAGLAEVDHAVQTRLAQLAWPQIDPDFGAGKGQPWIQILAIGYHHTLRRRAYNQTDLADDADLSVVATDVLDTCGVSPYGFISTYDIAENTLQVPREYDLDTDARSVLEALAGMGDANHDRWLSRVEVDRVYTLQRVVSMSGAWGVTKYFINVWEPLKVRTADSTILDLDEIPCNEWLMMEGAGSIGPKVFADGNIENPSISFIEAVNFRMGEGGRPDSVQIRATKENLLQSMFKKLGGVTG